MKRKIISYLVISSFSLVAILHFSRLTFNWDIIIGGWIVPTWLSGALILFAIFMLVGMLKSERKKKEELPRKEEVDT